MTNFNSIPKVNPDQLCEAWNLCSVREKNDISMIAVKYLDEKTVEIPLSEIIDIDNYEGLNIERTYSSGHIFLNDDFKKVYLISVEKRGNIQHQFTGGAPREQIFSEIIYTDKSDEDNNKLKVNITKVEDNALERTLLRTGVEVTEAYNTMPLVDRVLLENEKETIDGDGNKKTVKFWRLVLLMHFVVKSYEGELKAQNGVENVVGGSWYEVDGLPSADNVAANAYIVSKKAQDIVD